MKIGFSFGRCIRDIVNGKVAYDDVMLIIAATRIETVDQLEPVIDAYLQRPKYLWGLDKVKCLDLAHQLYYEGKIIQPRLQGITRTMMPEHAIWGDIYISPSNPNPSIQTAWEQYRMLVALCSTQNNNFKTITI